MTMTMTYFRCGLCHATKQCDCERKSSEGRDPWVKVGTTTIDGDRKQVAAALGLEVAGLDAVLGYTIADKRVLQVGGRNIIPVEWECNDHGGLVHCDIVYRQSEIDAEDERKHDDVIQRELDEVRRLHPMTCPECGPHGNRGEVLLASSWAKCTTCAGGKPGDLWGEVRPSEEPKCWSSVANKMVTFAEALALGRSLRRPEDEMTAEPEAMQGVKSYTLDIGDLALNKPPTSFMDARREALAAQHGQGFKVPTISELYMAEIDNLRRRLMGPPDGMTREEYRRIMFGE